MIKMQSQKQIKSVDKTNSILSSAFYIQKATDMVFLFWHINTKYNKPLCHNELFSYIAHKVLHWYINSN